MNDFTSYKNFADSQIKQVINIVNQTSLSTQNIAEANLRKHNE